MIYQLLCLELYFGPFPEQPGRHDTVTAYRRGDGGFEW